MQMKPKLNSSKIEISQDAKNEKCVHWIDH